MLSRYKNKCGMMWNGMAWYSFCSYFNLYSYLPPKVVYTSDPVTSPNKQPEQKNNNAKRTRIKERNSRWNPPVCKINVRMEVVASFEPNPPKLQTPQKRQYRKHSSPAKKQAPRLQQRNTISLRWRRWSSSRHSLPSFSP